MFETADVYVSSHSYRQGTTPRHVYNKSCSEDRELGCCMGNKRAAILKVSRRKHTFEPNIIKNKTAESLDILKGAWGILESWQKELPYLKDNCTDV